MSEVVYKPGVPCWVDTLQSDTPGAIAFYNDLFGWASVGPGPMPSGGEYFVEQRDGRDVAGIGTLASESGGAASWTTYVYVDDADAATQRATAAGAAVVAAPFDALPAGRAAVLADPQGAIFGLWQARDRQGAQLVNAPGAWAMSWLRTTDPERAQAFYAHVFGWTYQSFGDGPQPITLCRQAGYVGGTESQPVPRDVVAGLTAADASSASWNVDFWVADTDATAAQARSSGGRVLHGPYDVPMFRRAELADREGATFSVSQLIAPNA